MSKTWGEYAQTIDSLNSDEERNEYIQNELTSNFQTLEEKRGTNVIFYASAFLQKPDVPGVLTGLSREDLNGFMNVIRGMDYEAGLTLILHTPGGVSGAAKTIVEYLRDKFNYIEVIVPTFAMSAGTMISLSADRILMGKQSQLGPIDPQLPTDSGMTSALSIINQFDKARSEILGNEEEGIEGDERAAHLWAPILNSYGPALEEEARSVFSSGARLAEEWLRNYMLKDDEERNDKANNAVEFFSRTAAKDGHDRRINKEEAKENHLVIEDIEEDQDLQNSTLGLYHLLTIFFEKTPTIRMIDSSNFDEMGRKNWQKIHNVNPAQ